MPAQQALAARQASDGVESAVNLPCDALEGGVRDQVACRVTGWLVEEQATGSLPSQSVRQVVRGQRVAVQVIALRPEGGNQAREFAPRPLREVVPAACAGQQMAVETQVSATESCL